LGEAGAGEAKITAFANGSRGLIAGNGSDHLIRPLRKSAQNWRASSLKAGRIVAELSVGDFTPPFFSNDNEDVNIIRRRLYRLQQ
jgi:hypothetical protein